jgi:hypothetical protein
VISNRFISQRRKNRNKFSKGQKDTFHLAKIERETNRTPIITFSKPKQKVPLKNTNNGAITLNCQKLTEIFKILKSGFSLSL